MAGFVSVQHLYIARESNLGIGNSGHLAVTPALLAVGKPYQLWRNCFCLLNYLPL